MDTLTLPPSKKYVVQPMDTRLTMGNKDSDDDEEEIGLGYQRTLVSVVAFVAIAITLAQMDQF